MGKSKFIFASWVMVMLIASVPSPRAHAQLADDGLKFPYQAIVAADNAEIRSGPGLVHYATGKLKLNSSIEVYRHDPGGWCAIRPPNGSFSLIPESAMEILEDGVGRISESGTQAWVGTELGPVEKPLWQIKLKQGEVVEILGSANWPDPAGHSTTWYQISPPAGEFRWVPISDLRLPPTLEELVNSNPANANLVNSNPATSNSAVRSLLDSTGSSGSVQNASYQSEADQVPVVGPKNQPNSNYQSAGSKRYQDAQRSLGGLNAGWRQATNLIQRDQNTAAQTFQPQSLSSSNPPGHLGNFPQSTAGSSNYGAPERLASANLNSGFDLQTLRNANPSFPTNSTGAFASNSNQPMSVRLAEVELKLNNEMIKNPGQWRLIDLQSETQAVFQGTSDPLERLQAKTLLEKLENCGNIRAGYVSAYQDDPNSKGAIGSGLVASDITLSTTYDASGWLNELVRNGGSSKSTFVLQNDAGKITHHVSPSPGLNLRPYLKKKIGVIGQRGYHKELKLNHVTAQRVIDLKRHQ